MVVFTLTMPNRNSWNGKWHGDGYLHARAMKNGKVPKEVIGRDFYYSWADGWTACISVSKMDYKEANRLIKKSCGFCGYGWMIESIINYGEIKYKHN